MIQKFRLFVQRHENGIYTVTVPGLPRVPETDEWEDERPETKSLASYGLMLAEVKEDVLQALARWLSKADPAQLHRCTNYKESQWLEKVDLELRPSDRHGRKRHDRVKLKVSLLLTKEEGEQHLVSVPKLTEPPLSFYCYAKEELKETATRELAAYFADFSLEALLEYQHQRQELLEAAEVEFTPLKPQKEKKKAAGEEETISWALRSAGVNLTARAREKKLHRAFRREREVREILNVLAAESNASLLLVGPSGAGKTAIAHEVVRRIHEEDCPPALRKRQVWYTTASQLIAGCSYIGQWQQKLQEIVDEVKRRRHVLHIDDLPGLIEAGRWSKGDENMAQFLKPFLADGTVVVIGECTPERYRVAENLDPGFLALFRKVDVEESDEQATLSILGTVGASLEREFELRIEPSAREAVVELTRRFQPYRSFPGKAVSFLQQAAADAARADSQGRPIITRQYLVRAFAEHTGLPEFILSDHLTLEPASVERYVSERLIGQPDTVRTVVDLVTVIKAGLNDPQKPLGCFFFVGPTGVGKTEMAKTLAEYLFGSRDRMLRFDMSEYAEPFNVGRLIGTAHGKEEGELTKRIRLQPFSVVLLDEFEKAHPSIFDVMLQVLGEGRLTDAGGRTADFRSAIILMTSNLGASPREQRKPSLRVDDTVRSLASHFQKKVEEFFRPEFVNRLDKIVVFRALDRDSMRQIAARELAHLLEREGITRRSLLVEVEDDVIDLLLETGFSPVYGARPLKREIERRVIIPLARYLVAHRVAESQLIQIRRDGDQVGLFSTMLAPAKQRVKTVAPLATDQPADGRKMDLKELVEGYAAVRLRLHQWAEGDTVGEIENEYTQLLARTRQRDFLDFGEEAHKVWTRIYHLERLTKRLRQLRDRADYLEEFATLTQRQREERYQPDLAESYVELCRDVDFLEIELLCAHLEESGHAVLRLKSLGRPVRGAREQPWLWVLARMYLRWAKRKGYDLAVFAPTDAYRRWLEEQGLDVPSGDGETGRRGDGAKRRDLVSRPLAPSPTRPVASQPWTEVRSLREARRGEFEPLYRRLATMEVPELAISIRGTNAFGFLKGEAGAHKLLARPDDTDALAPFQTVAVRAEPLEEDASALEWLTCAWEAQEKQKEGRRGGHGGRLAGDPGVRRRTRPVGSAASRSRADEEEAQPDGALASGSTIGTSKEDEAPEVIRLYMPDGDRYVRDLRTDVRTTRVREVLDGDLDEFILAYLKTEEASRAWSRT